MIITVQHPLLGETLVEVTAQIYGDRVRPIARVSAHANAVNGYYIRGGSFFRQTKAGLPSQMASGFRTRPDNNTSALLRAAADEVLASQEVIQAGPSAINETIDKRLASIDSKVADLQAERAVLAAAVVSS